MVNLEKIVNELPQLVLSLKLNLGSSNDIMPQIILINNIQDQLRDAQKIILQELRVAQVQNSSISTLPHIAGIASMFIPQIVSGNTAITARTKYMMAKFGNATTKISINDLQSKIDSWIEWGDLLHVISADILNNSQLVSQINSDSNHLNLSSQVKKLSENLKINLAFAVPQILQQQLQQLRNSQAEALQVKEKLNYILHTIKSIPNLLSILLGISCFCGKSGFSLEWLDDDQELIISSNGKFQELTDILNECEELQKIVDNLMFKLDTLVKQSEQSLIQFETEIQPEPVINYQEKLQTKIVPNFKLQNVFHPKFLIASSLLVLIFSGWMIKNQFSYFQQTILISNQEETAVNNFKSALKLGLEASSLVKDPPHSLMVWQQAETKWEEAIDLLGSIPKGTSVYTQANDRLILYRFNLNAINKRATNEKKATENFQLAQKLATEADFFVKTSPQSVSNLTQAKDKFQQAISLLENIPKSTFIYQQAQEILPSYKSNYAGIQLTIKD
ncbi:hypothetical protein [Nodularia sp. UHCC 0506]|uniref:hypothetical protein n=1 Tax=Nodularia sp. UHCC 0506 TaxID=3110243 RepID=UPI002B21CA46|nr:hypothetical protein [Nodularia sp. UHCC 0506]MEA5512711.1 hypothetical protein [Nodularia sp. UHCC 0506]